MAMQSRVVAGRYRLERLLGEGASGRVYLARDTKERGAVWAVKELDYSALPIDEFEEARRHFQREAELLKRLRHPSLPQVVDHFQVEDRDYLVMERVEGPTLEGLIEKRTEPLSEQRVVLLACGLVDTLHYLHHRNPPIIYRDLKPANVMVTMDGGVKLIDFGIARSVTPSRPGDTTAYGTPGYAPPEQYQGRTVPASDIYALGVTLHRAATLYEPPEFTFSHPPVTELNPALSVDLERLIRDMVAKQACDRPSTAFLIAMFEKLRDSPRDAALQVWWRKNSRGLKKWWTDKRKEKPSS